MASYIEERQYKEKNIEDLKQLGRNKVKRLMITSFIANGESKDMNKYQIASSFNVNSNDKETMRHIEVQLKRKEDREG